MSRPHPFLSASLAVVGLSVVASAQPPAAPLKAGATVSGRLAAGDTARFALALRDSTFVLGSVTQPDAPLAVRLVAGGQARARFEGPGAGALRFAAMMGDTGTVVVEVTAPSRRAAGFALTLLRQEPRARAPPPPDHQQQDPNHTPPKPGGVGSVWRDWRGM